MNGYHEFHRSMVVHNGIALNVVSAWNTLLLLVQALLHHYNGNIMWNTWFTHITCIVAFQLSETIILITTHGCYIGKLCRNI